MGTILSSVSAVLSRLLLLLLVSSAESSLGFDGLFSWLVSSPIAEKEEGMGLRVGDDGGGGCTYLCRSGKGPPCINIAV